MWFKFLSQVKIPTSKAQVHLSSYTKLQAFNENLLKKSMILSKLQWKPLDNANE